ncbi:hypothetical protein [Fructobacillus parabroussonetiae]|uniref:t-SNARE coiled-coil homology domain-containing protein n=1 Tax=Fructobacillus parabroussonetiae TaxID=2713174 RepID=A0ABS5QYR9_9LACO|nr:hypothetical protein [Fructobacillus parabroussonetiae]MBS9337937.1 hypothetical protein [Fructobacillus parabroussonetiae]
MTKQNEQFPSHKPDWVTRQEFQEFKTDVNQHFEQIDHQFAQVDLQFGRINNRLDRIDDRLDLIDEKFAVRDKQFLDIEKNIDRRFHAQNQSLIARIERNNRQQWAWNITILLAIITLVVTMHR